jgi:hypothetical protein
MPALPARRPAVVGPVVERGVSPQHATSPNTPKLHFTHGGSVADLALGRQAVLARAEVSERSASGSRPVADG